MLVGVENAVQIVTENASNYVVMGRLLTDQFLAIFYTLFVTHCSDPTLEDIGKLEWFNYYGQGKVHNTGPQLNEELGTSPMFHRCFPPKMGKFGRHSSMVLGMAG